MKNQQDQEKKGIDVDERYEQTLLYDFYGELLTKHQQMVYEDFTLNDFSLSEIAEEQGISRQGVHDMVKRCNKLLSGYEEKLHLVEKFIAIREKTEEISRIAEQLGKDSMKQIAEIHRIEKISREILEEL